MYTVYFTLFLLISFLVFKMISYLKRRRETRKLREAWGGFSLTITDLESSEIHFRMKERVETIKDYLIDDSTWKDLNLDDLFQLLNRTITPTGSQYLYSLLRTPLLDEKEIKERGKLIDFFLNNSELREKLQLILLDLSSPYAKYLPYALWQNLPPKNILSLIFNFLSFISSTVFILFVAGFINGGFVVVVFLINLGIRTLWMKEKKMFLAAFQYLYTLIKTANKINSVKEPILNDIQKVLSTSLTNTVSIARKIFSLQFGDNDPFMTYINIYFLFDIVGVYSSLDSIKQNSSSLKKLFETVGYIDSMISIASFKKGLLYNCEPEFSRASNIFMMRDIYHPILNNPVPNDFSFSCKNIIITGSNMSGKSTFLKTIGINCILAQNFNLAAAQKYVAPIIKIISSIERNEDLITGKSYYLAEVESILKIVNSSTTSLVHLFIIDEIFRGTNSIERTASSCAVLKYLNNNKDFVLVATHDLQLTEEMNTIYKNYHFAEEIEDDGLSFNYKLHIGVSKSRNAIALLKFAKYPESIIKDASNRIK